MPEPSLQSARPAAWTIELQIRTNNTDSYPTTQTFTLH
jgi:hypothetical protein